MFTRGVKKKKRRRKLKRANLDFVNGDVVRFRDNRIHRKKRYTFLCIHTHSGQALLYRAGPTDRSQYYVLTNLKKIEKVRLQRKKETAEVSEG